MILDISERKETMTNMSWSPFSFGGQRRQLRIAAVGIAIIIV